MSVLLLVLSVIAATGACVWTYIVIVSNMMHMTSAKFVGGGTLVLAWLPTAALWYAWSVG